MLQPKNHFLKMIADRRVHYDHALSIHIIACIRNIVLNYIMSYSNDYASQYELYVYTKNMQYTKTAWFARQIDIIGYPPDVYTVSIHPYIHNYLHSLSIVFGIFIDHSEYWEYDNYGSRIYPKYDWDLGDVDRYYKSGDITILVEPVYEALVDQIGFTSEYGAYLADLLTRGVLDKLIEPVVNANYMPRRYINDDDYLTIKAAATQNQSQKKKARGPKKHKRRAKNRRSRRG